jgi:bacteriocin-like protein
MNEPKDTPAPPADNELTEDALEQISGGVGSTQQNPSKVIESIGVKYVIGDEAGTLKG